MSSTIRRHARFARLAGGLSVAAVLAFGVLTPAAEAVPSSPQEAAITLGAQAATSLGDAASDAMAASAAAGMTELGRVAATVTITAPAKVADPALAPSGLSWSGWKSGAAGTEAEDGSFATWRGSPLGVVGVWCDATLEAQTNLDAVDNYAGYTGDMDVAVGIFVRGETWQQAAAGQFVDRWTATMRKLREKRAGKGITYVRIAHEFNGDWMPWGMNASSYDAYLKAYRMYVTIVRKEFPEARIVWSPNGGNHTNVSIDKLYPGSQYVDVIGPDIYDGFPDVTSPALWKQNSEKWLNSANPQGLAAWQVWAARRGKPLALPEWGLPYGDHPQFIKGVHDTLATYAARSGKVSNAGRIVYDVYFNVEQKFKIYNGPNTAAGAMYRSLKWGS